MRTEYKVRSWFIASHCLDWWGSDHECARLHSHKFTIEVIVTGYSEGHEGSSTVDLAELRDAVDAFSRQITTKGDITSMKDCSCEGICDAYHLVLSAGFVVQSVEIWEDERTGIRRVYDV